VEQPAGAGLALPEIQQNADEDEQGLGDQSGGEVDDHARARDRAGDPGAGQEPRAHELTSDLSHRQQTVDGSAYPALDHHRAQGRPLRLGEERAPPERIGEQGAEVRQADQGDAPARDSDRRGDVAEVLRRDQAGD
jgi:hypothetical protein